MGVVGRLDQYASMLAYEFDDYSMSENLLTYSEQFNDASWAKNNYNVTANATTAPDGTLTADKLIAINASTFHDLFKSPGLSSNTYTLSIFAKAAEQSFIQLRIDDGVLTRVAMFNLSTGSVSSSSNVTSPTITSYSNGWYRCSITVTTNIINVVFNGFPTSSNATYSGDGVSGVFIWGAQFERGTLTDYTPTTTTAISRVLPATTNTNITGLGTYYSSGFDENTSITTLVQTGENLLTYSGIPSANWSTSGSAVLTNNSSISPDGGTNATLITASAVIGSGIFRTISLTIGTVYTYSVFVKAVSGSNSIYFGTNAGGNALVQINTSTGVVSVISGSPINFTSTPYPYGWYRVSVTFTCAAVNETFVIYNWTASANTWLAWGAQIERGSVATDYIPTTTTTGSRSLPSPILALSANVFAPYDPVYDEFSGTSFGAGQGRYMRQNTDKSVIVYNEIDEITDLFGRGIVRDGLVLDLDAGITASYPGSGTTWTDLSASGNNGTLINGLTYSSANGGSIVFDGSNDTVRIPISASLQSANFTFDIWVRSNVTSGDQMFFSSHYESFGTPSGIRSGISNEQATRLYYFVTYFNGSYEYTGGGLPDPSSNTNVWINVVGTWDGTNRKRYFNSTFQGLQNVAGEIHSQLNDFYLGNNADTIANNNYTNSVLNGSIAAFKFYNRALSAAEITQNYNALKHRFGL